MSGNSPIPPIAMESRRGEKARLFSPSAERNKDVIAQHLSGILPQGARVLEIGAGTGQHAATVCAVRPDLTWQPTDPDAQSRDSQDSWAQDVNGSILPSLALDASDLAWPQKVGQVEAIVCCNVIHIAPWSVAQGLVRGAEDVLQQGAPLVLYGPFLTGENSAPSNLEFDRSLRSRNPEWGVRPLADVVTLAESHGFALESQIDMPANNLMLVFERSAR